MDKDLKKFYRTGIKEFADLIDDETVLRLLYQWAKAGWAEDASLKQKGKE